MKKIRMIASDMDGTLVNDKGVISQENAQAIRKAQELGIEVVIATGRPYLGARTELKELGLELPIISLNGAEIYSAEGERLKTTPLSKEDVLEIVKVCKEQNVYCDVYTDDGILSSDEEEHLEMFFDIIKTSNPNPNLTKEDIRPHVQERVEKDKVKFVSDQEVAVEQLTVGINKLVLFSAKDGVLYSVRKALEVLDLNINLSRSSSNNLEINHPDAHKGAAVQYFAQKLNIPMDEVMTIGDNLNDMTMLRMAGRGVAMENASEEIKRVVRYHTKANYENGVAYAIEDMFKDCYQS